MSLSDRYKKKANEISKARESLAVERARATIKSIMETDQFKLSALALPESAPVVDAIVTQTVSSVLDPVAQLKDTLNCKGFRPAEIRRVVHNLNQLYKLVPETPTTTFEDMVGPVADYLLMHPEIYNTLDPDDLRED